MSHLEQDYGISHITDMHLGQEVYFVQLRVSFSKRINSLSIEYGILTVIH